MDLQYWSNGEPILPIDDSSMKELKYWLNGSGFIVLDATAAAAGTNTQINIGDTFKEISAMQLNIGDSWKAVDAIKINVGDTWKDVF